MSVDSFNPDTVWQPFGAFSMAVVQGAGKVIHLKGQVSLDREGGIVGEGDIETQVAKALENMQNVLASFGGRMEDVYSLTHHVTDIDAFMMTGHIRSRYFKPPYPVTTTVEVARLYHPSLMVEITGSAEIPLDRFAESGPSSGS
jgi:2-iminobutanoate/2-iminopropanoate deaminase